MTFVRIIENPRPMHLTVVHYLTVILFLLFDCEKTSMALVSAPKTPKFINLSNIILTVILILSNI
jgi:hypothetical protein